jgi:hypothetical protein
VTDGRGEDGISDGEVEEGVGCDAEDEKPKSTIGNTMKASRVMRKRRRLTP